MLDLSNWDRAPAGMVARGTVTRSDGVRFVLQMQIDAAGSSETKTLEADDCATLADAYAVVVAFAIDPSAQARDARTEGRAAPTPEPEVEPPHSAPPTPRPPSTIRGVVGPILAGGAGMLPFPAIGVGARIGIESRLWWELAGTYWPDRPVSVTVDPGTTVGGHVSFGFLEPGACLPFVRGALAACLGAELGLMPGKGTEAPRVGSGSSWWVAPTAGVAARVRIAHVLDLGLRLDVGVPILRPSFVVKDIDSRESVQVFRPGAVSGVLAVEALVPFFSTESSKARHDGR
jgi:hypothetical protein